jgi:hypothetical protein
MPADAARNGNAITGSNSTSLIGASYIRSVSTHERELRDDVALADWRGRLRPEAIGYSRRALHDAAIPGRWGRRKRWEYWCVIGARGALQVTVADLDYLALVELSFVDFETEEIASVPFVLPLGAGLALPDRSGEDWRVRTPLGSAALRVLGDETHLSVRARTPRGALDAHVVIATPPHEESLSVVVPWSDRSFQLTTKRVALPVHGEIRALGRHYAVDEAHESFACLDFGRGVWPRETTWNWGTGAVRTADGTRLGLQLGGKWTDGTGATENGLFVDGRLDKIGSDLRWSYAEAAFMEPWRVRDGADEIDLTFTPFFERVAKLDLSVLRTELHLCFGRWSGRVGARRVVGALGWAEEHRARW